PPRSTHFPYTTLFRSIQQPNPVDQFSENTNGSSKSAAAQDSPEKNVSPANLTEPATEPATGSTTTIGTTNPPGVGPLDPGASLRSEEHTSELQSPYDL